MFSYLFSFLFLNYETFQNNVRYSYADHLVLTDTNVLHSYDCFFGKIFFTKKKQNKTVKLFVGVIREMNHLNRNYLVTFILKLIRILKADKDL